MQKNRFRFLRKHWKRLVIYWRENETRSEIENTVNERLREKGRYTKSLSKELYQSYRDEVTSLEEQGKEEKEAEEKVKDALILSLNSIVPKEPLNQVFPILISAFFLLTFGKLIAANVSSSIALPLWRYLLVAFLFSIGWLL